MNTAKVALRRPVRLGGAASVRRRLPMAVDRDGRAIALGSQLLRVERKPAPALLAA